MKITEQLLTKNKYSRPCTFLKAVKGIVVHWVANPGSSAAANRNYFEGLKNQVPHGDGVFASAHYIIGLDGEVIRCVPDKEVCYHAGADRYTNEALRRLSSYPNNCTIGIELCHPDWSGRFNDATLRSCGELVSSLLTAYGLTRDDVWRHYDIVLPTKSCPKWFVDHPNEWGLFINSLGETV
jgi:N-acetylmuramoyl-L-alanine amidase CwlA